VPREARPSQHGADGLAPFPLPRSLLEAFLAKDV